MAKPPPSTTTKKGWGCCGCGCAILVLIVILLLGLIGGATYLAYSSSIKFTSATPANIPKYDGGDDVYGSAQQKLKGFDHDVKNHVAATIHLSADEINTLIAREPNFTKNNLHVFVTFNDDQARIQFSLPTGPLSSDLLKGRYLNGNTSFGLTFDPDTKLINLNFKSLEVGPAVVPQENLAGLQSGLNQAINSILQKDPDSKAFLDQASSIQIKNNELVIETK